MSESRYIHDPAYHNHKAASRIVPIIHNLFHPRSVLDVGCGTGDFLKAFTDLGVTDIAGIDGAWLNKSMLVVPDEKIRILDLEQPFSLGRKYDVLLCLEVAEHLNESAARNFIASLVKHADVIVFSAAIPHQGGQNHVNEQWLDYWKELFEHHRFYLHDLLRPLIWNDKEIFWWYRQNIVVCVSGSLRERGGEVHSYIHPELYVAKLWQANAYKEWIDKIISGDIEVAMAQAILHNAQKRESTK